MPPLLLSLAVGSCIARYRNERRLALQDAKTVGLPIMAYLVSHSEDRQQQYPRPIA
jgi:hypothetical protein